jgi:flagellar motility protein MotE (MotC chaperone)
MTRAAGVFSARSIASWRGLVPFLLLVVLGLAAIGKLALLLDQIVGTSAPGPAPRMHARAAPADHEEAALPEPAAGPASPIHETGGSPGAGPPAEPEPDTQVPQPLDPVRLTASEIEVLRQLAARRAELEQREDQLALREALLGTAEARLLEQAERLNQLRAEIEALVEEVDQKEQARLGNLVKIYEAMKPKAAAEIFNRLEMPLLVQVVQRMREAKSADVLARMDPVKAKQLTAELVRRSRPSGSAGEKAERADRRV